MKLRLLLFLPLLILLISCGDDDLYYYEDDLTTVPEAFSTEGITPDTTDSGLIIYTIAEGNSDISVTIRDQVSVYYTGRKTNGEVFDSSYKNSQTDPTIFSVAGLIEGFTEGLIGMEEGGKRVIIVPPELGYAGTTNALYADTLVFDLELDTIFF